MTDEYISSTQTIYTCHKGQKLKYRYDTMYSLRYLPARRPQHWLVQLFEGSKDNLQLSVEQPSHFTKPESSHDEAGQLPQFGLGLVEFETGSPQQLPGPCAQSLQLNLSVWMLMNFETNITRNK